MRRAMLILVALGTLTACHQPSGTSGNGWSQDDIAQLQDGFARANVETGSPKSQSAVDCLTSGIMRHVTAAEWDWILQTDKYPPWYTDVSRSCGLR